MKTPEAKLLTGEQRFWVLIASISGGVILGASIFGIANGLITLGLP